MFLLTFLYVITASIFYLFFTTELQATTENIETVRLVIFIIMLPLLIKYFFQLSVIPLYKRRDNKQKKGKVANIEQPKVSVLIPAWNEEVGILKTIQSVASSSYQHLEIIIINDGSTDSTHDLVTKYIDLWRKNNSGTSRTINYLCLPNGGKAHALNKGLKSASGDIIVTIDADSVMDEDAIYRLVEAFDDQNVGAVAGNVIVGNRRKSLALLQQLEYLYGFFFKRADSFFNAVYIIGGAAAAYRKTTLDKVGGFDTQVITEDIEMSMRILSEGYKTRYACDAVIYTEGPSEWGGLCKQRLRWKFGRIMTFIKHRRLFFNTRVGNPYLSFLLLPVALYAEVCLLLEALLLGVFYTYTIYSNDYFPLVCVIVFITCLVSIQILIDSKSKFHRNILCLAPVAWLLFYVIDIVEFQALTRSLKRIFKQQELEWQKWNRAGLKHSRFKTDETLLELGSVEPTP